MKIFVLFFLLLLSSLFAVGQVNVIKINGTKLISVRQILGNEHQTKDTLVNLYRIENKQRKLVHTFYLYKDEGGDCNNLFWNVGTMTIQNDNLIFLTNYLQKLHDPIPALRKRIYQVSKKGELTLIFDKYKRKDDQEWQMIDYNGE